METERTGERKGKAEQGRSGVDPNCHRSGKDPTQCCTGTHTLPTRRRTRAGLILEQAWLQMEVHLSQCSSKPSEDTVWKVRRDGLHPQSYCPLLQTKGQIPSKEGGVVCLKWGWWDKRESPSPPPLAILMPPTAPQCSLHHLPSGQYEPLMQWNSLFLPLPVPPTHPSPLLPSPLPLLPPPWPPSSPSIPLLLPSLPLHLLPTPPPPSAFNLKLRM